jgi:hypothetical protein
VRSPTITAALANNGVAPSMQVRVSTNQGSALVRQAKRARSARRQLGQFLTPEALARRVAEPELSAGHRRILEPSFGVGGFLLPVIESLVSEGRGSTNLRLGKVLTEQLWGVELDPVLYERCLAVITERWGALPPDHNLVLGDYFRFEPPFEGLDLIIGNPPFGGTFDAEIEDVLDRRFGRYLGDKVKKETYSFFVAKAIEELSPQGVLKFICSDTFLTIKTMKGLRRKLIDSGRCEVDRLPAFSDETAQPMVILTLRAGPSEDAACIFGTSVARGAMEKTANFSWAISTDLVEYFDGPTLGEYIVATGGMTIGKNELFVRPINGGRIEEPYDFEFFDDAISLEGERRRARLGKLSPTLEARYRVAEAEGATRRNIRVIPRDRPDSLALPHPDYRPYNKASPGRLYSPPTRMVYWKDEGDAVLTFKKNGPWYLHGVGGRPYFLREGLTWQLVAPRINARYLPADYILDSGAPCAFLRDGVVQDELWFVLAWLQTDLASMLLKQVINHTRNIQGKDIERLPYPYWVPPESKHVIIESVERAVRSLMVRCQSPTHDFSSQLEARFALPPTGADLQAA